MFVTLLCLLVLLLPAWQFACDCAASVRSRATCAPITPDLPSAAPITPALPEFTGITKVIAAAALPAPERKGWPRDSRGRFCPAHIAVFWA